MKSEWLFRDESKELILFFNGWGMDSRVVNHLESMSDVLVIYDYRKLEPEVLSGLEKYDRIVMIAWSMGVWAAEQVFRNMPWTPERCVAINGTGFPVDNSHGIPEKVYCLTENNMTEKARDKFFARMFITEQDRARFMTHSPQRDLREQAEELSAIRLQGVQNSYLKWDKAYISDKDLIFPVANQFFYWKDRNPVITLDSGHYPFYCFTSWQEIYD